MQRQVRPLAPLKCWPQLGVLGWLLASVCPGRSGKQRRQRAGHSHDPTLTLRTRQEKGFFQKRLLIDFLVARGGLGFWGARVGPGKDGSHWHCGVFVILRINEVTCLEAFRKRKKLGSLLISDAPHPKVAASFISSTFGPNNMAPNFYFSPFLPRAGLPSRS